MWDRLLWTFSFEAFSWFHHAFGISSGSTWRLLFSESTQYSVGIADQITKATELNSLIGNEDKKITRLLRGGLLGRPCKIISLMRIGLIRLLLIMRMLVTKSLRLATATAAEEMRVSSASASEMALSSVIVFTWNTCNVVETSESTDSIYSNYRLTGWPLKSHKCHQIDWTFLGKIDSQLFIFAEVFLQNCQKEEILLQFFQGESFQSLNWV